MDPIQTLLGSPSARGVARRLGLAPPAPLRRYTPGQPLLTGPALVAGSSTGRLLGPAVAVLRRAGADVVLAGPVSAGPVDAGLVDAGPVDAGSGWGALVFDASAVGDPAGLIELRDFFAPALRHLAAGGRVLVLGTPSGRAGSRDASIAQRALEGFIRSVGKELRDGSTAQLVLVDPGAEDRLGSTLQFLASARSAFVDGQVVRISSVVPDPPAGGVAGSGGGRPLTGRVVVVTGAARGIGAAMVRTFSRDGASVIGVDVAVLAGELEQVTSAAGGSHLVADVTAADAGVRIARAVRDRHGLVHGVVHNAGITRDRRLVNLSRDAWQQVIDVNLVGPRRITDDLLADGVLATGGRIVGISSIAGIAGNPGQTNYAASKAGVIGLVEALAPELAGRGVTVNAIAPGFIETPMTRRVPLLIREGGRRLSSLRQGGLPTDVAETAGWLLDPASAGITGQVLRVCGQSLIGA